MQALNDIQTQIDRMKALGRTWLIVGAVAVILAIILLITVFRPKRDSANMMRVQALDSVIKYQQATIDALQRSNQIQDSIIAGLDQKYSENRKTETRIIHQYEKIPSTVRDLNREQLRGEIANY